MTTLTAEQELRYVERIRGGDSAAREEFASLYLDLARDFAHRYCRYGLDYDDLESAAMEGLATAIDRIEREGVRGGKRFDPSRARFSTYASCWMEAGVRRAASAEMSLPTVPADSICLDADGEMSLLKLVAVSDDTGPFRSAALSEAKDMLMRLMEECLTPDERFVLERHYGLNGNGGATDTLAVIGRAMGTSRQNVHHLESSALEKLRRCCSSLL